MSEKTLCPACGEGHLTLRHENTVAEYKGHKGTVSTLLAECDVCGSELAGDAESRANKRAVLSFRKTVDGLLTGEEIRAIRENVLIRLSPRPTTGSGFENRRNHGNAGAAILAKPCETRPVCRRVVVLMDFLGTPYLVALGDNPISTREKYQLTQAQAAKLFGGGPVAFSKYENDNVAHSEAMGNLLRLVRRSEEAYWELVEEKQLEELLHRRPARTAHYASPNVVHVVLALRMEESAPSQRTNQLSYLTPHRSTHFEVPQWMQ
jgi:transcriptional regulator with XRE-family HTH domain